MYNFNQLQNPELTPSSPVDVESPYTGLTRRYTFVSTADIIDEMDSAGFYLASMSSSRCRNPGKKPYVKHMMRFRQSFLGTDLHLLERLPEEAPEIIVINSHDGTSAIKIMLGFYRFACANGLFVGNTHAQIRVSHADKRACHKVTMAANELMEKAQDYRRDIDLWKSLNLTVHQQLDLAKSAHKLLPDGNAKTNVPSSQLLWSRRLEDNANDLWTVFNVIQENMLVGGQRYYANGRRGSRRSVKSLKEIERLNTALWETAAAMADFLTGSGDYAEESMADMGY